MDLLLVIAAALATDLAELMMVAVVAVHYLNQTLVMIMCFW
jgi:hypothetical protein